MSNSGSFSYSPQANRRMLLDKAGLLCELERFDEAAQLLQTLLGDDPEDFDALCMLARVRIHLSDARAALELADKAIAVAPTNEIGFRIRSTALLRIDPRQALESARDAVQLAPESRRALITLIRALLSCDRPSDAETVGKKLLEVAPDDAVTYELLAAIAFAGKFWAEAEDKYIDALKRDPSNPNPHHNLGLAQFNRRRYAEAAESFARAAKLDPTFQEARQMSARSVKGHIYGFSTMTRNPNRYSMLLGPFHIFLSGVAYMVIAIVSAVFGDWTMIRGAFFVGACFLLFQVFLLYTHYQRFRSFSTPVRRFCILENCRWLQRWSPELFDRLLIVECGKETRYA